MNKFGLILRHIAFFLFPVPSGIRLHAYFGTRRNACAPREASAVKRREFITLLGGAAVAAFREALQKLGWTDGRNALIEYRSGAADNELLRKYAAEIVAHEPDVVLTAGATITAALQRASRSVAIVFVNVTDPVGAGLVATLARPEGNASGFTQFEFGISAKWLELLKEIAPTVTRVVVVRDPTARTGGGQLGAIQAVAPSLG